MADSIQKLTHWGLAGYFYPQAAVKMSPDGQQPRLLIEPPPKPTTSRKFVWTLGKTVSWVIPAILLAVYAWYLHSEMGQIRKENTVLKEANVVTPDPVTTTVFSTFFSTFTATTTSVSTATTTLTVGNKWFFAGESSAVSEPPEPTHFPWESIDDPPPVYTSTPSAKPSPEPTHSKNDVFETLKNPSPWPSIQLPSNKEMTEQLRWAMVKLWKVVLKVWHYPLDPP